MGEYAKGLKFSQQALAIYKQVGDLEAKGSEDDSSQDNSFRYPRLT
ncbi:MAG: hypothetical protein ACYT04_05280 [Nostoc sp.]